MHLGLHVPAVEDLLKAGGKLHAKHVDIADQIPVILQAVLGLERRRRRKSGQLDKEATEGVRDSLAACLDLAEAEASKVVAAVRQNPAKVVRHTRHKGADHQVAQPLKDVVLKKGKRKKKEKKEEGKTKRKGFKGEEKNQENQRPQRRASLDLFWGCFALIFSPFLISTLAIHSGSTSSNMSAS